MRKMAPVDYDPEATCLEWENFLKQIMDGDEELISFLQRAAGYALTGEISEQCFFLMHGKGANGKSTFINTIMRVLGDYAKQANFSTFLKRNRNGVPNDIARLEGTRLISAGEVAAEETLDEVMLKQMTGGDTVSARYLYREWFDFKMEGKIFLTVNHRPEIQGADEGTWRRIRLIPFEVTIPEGERDVDLSKKLEQEIKGILAWAVKGCLEWQKHGLNPPEKVMAATREYREEMDRLDEWIVGRCETGPESDFFDPHLDLYDNYTNWCKVHNDKVLSKKQFTKVMEDRGFTKKKKTTNPKKGITHWFGIRRKSHWREMDEPSPEKKDEDMDTLLAELL
jgi:putative DNA primase/helicase